MLSQLHPPRKRCPVSTTWYFLRKLRSTHNRRTNTERVGCCPSSFFTLRPPNNDVLGLCSSKASLEHHYTYRRESLTPSRVTEGQGLKVSVACLDIGSYSTLKQNVVRFCRSRTH